MRIDNYELAVKAQVIDFLLTHHSDNSIISCELPFADGRRRADIVLIDDRLHAFEVKSARDNLDKLAMQIADYQDSFDEVTVVTVASHIQKARKILPKRVGILLVDSDDIYWVRRPLFKVRLDKIRRLSFINADQLKKKVNSLFPKKNMKKESIQLVRKRIAKVLTLEEINQLVIPYLHQKYGRRFRAFYKDRGNVTHPEDIKMLSTQFGKII